MASSKGSVSLNRKAVFVSITKALNGKVPDVKVNVTPLQDIARGCWYVNDAKIKQCELLVAVYDGVIKGVWEIDRNAGWRIMSINAIPTRTFKPADIDPRRKYCELKGKVMCDIVGHRLTVIRGMARMRGPIQYNF